MIGFVSEPGGFAASAAALAFGAVVFVEPIISLGLLISMLLGALIGHRNLRRHDWIAAGVLCAGVSLFLYETSPTGGRDLVPPLRWAIAAPCIAVVVVACVVAARGSSSGPARHAARHRRPVAFAASAMLTKAFVHYLGEGPFAWAPHWEPYAMAVTILLGFLLVQSAFQAGSLAAAVAGIEATEPVVAVVLGVVLLDEHVAREVRPAWSRSSSPRLQSSRHSSRWRTSRTGASPISPRDPSTTNGPLPSHPGRPERSCAAGREPLISPR